MRKNLENKLTMYEGVLGLLQDNDEIVRTVSGFPDSISGLGTVVNDLKAKSIEADKATTGKTSTKYDAEDDLVDCLLGACSMLYVLGKKQKNNEIMERADITESRLRRMRDTDLASYSADIANTAEASSADLEALGMTAARIADIKTKSDAYSAALSSRETGMANRIGSHEAMKDLFNKADDIIYGELDRFIELFRRDNPEFYDKNQAARVIRDIGIRHRPPTEAVGSSESTDSEEPAGSAV